MENIHMKTDVLVIGAGIAGCTMALALRPRYSVTLIDKYATPQPKPGESLPPAASRIFRKLELSNILGSEKHLTCHGMTSNWATNYPITTDNLRNPDGMGWHVNRQQLEQDLRNVAQARGVNLITSATVTQASFTQSHWQCTLIQQERGCAERKQSLSATIVIDATGRHGAFARQFVKTEHNKRQQFDKLMSVWLSYPSGNSQTLSTLIPTENGWWYSAPLPKLPATCEGSTGFVHRRSCQDTHRSCEDTHYRMLAWQTDADLMDKALTEKTRSGSAYSDNESTKKQQPEPQLNAHPAIDAILAQAAQHPALAKELATMDTHRIQHHGIVSANSSRLKHASGRHWFAIGDAAMSFDPLSSQGMFNGMATAMQLADLLNSIEFSSAESLQRIALTYQRQLDNIWQHYLNHRDYYYNQETRWQNSEFWQRRG